MRAHRSAWPLWLAAAAGAITLQLALALSVEAGVWPAALAAARFAVLAGALAALADAGVAMVRGDSASSAGRRPRACLHHVSRHPAPKALPTPSTNPCQSQRGTPSPSDFGLRTSDFGLGIVRRLGPWQVVAATGVVLALLLWRHPSRLVLNEVGFVLTAAPLAWVVARRAGRGAAVEAALALAALALAATFADVRQPLSTVEWQPDSRYRWATGWPADGWVLRHVIALNRPAEARAMTLTAPLTRDYSGPGRILARVNDHDLGEATISGHLLDVALPPAVVAGQTRLTVELRASQPDPNLRLTAFRVTRGATLGSQASSYYDTAAQRWFPGTFNDALGRPQPGIYVLELSVRP